MKINCCQTHIEHALDMFVAKQNTFPILTEISDDEKLSTKCDYCDVVAIYLVANEWLHNIYSFACGYVYNFCG